MKDKLKLRAARMQAELKAEHVCRAMNISRSTLYAWERGVYLPSIPNAKKLAELYGVESINDLKL